MCVRGRSGVVTISHCFMIPGSMTFSSVATLTGMLAIADPMTSHASVTGILLSIDQHRREGSGQAQPDRSTIGSGAWKKSRVDASKIKREMNKQSHSQRDGHST